MYWFGLVAGWMVALMPASLAALATAVPMLWKSEPGLEVAIPTVWAVAGAVRQRDAACAKGAMCRFISFLPAAPVGPA